MREHAKPRQIDPGIGASTVIDALIVCALRPEAGAISGRMRDAEVLRIGRLQAHQGLFGGMQTIVIRTNPGAEKALEALKTALNVIKPRIAVNFGTAGAVDTALPLGKPVLSESAVAFDPGTCDIQPDTDPWHINGELKTALAQASDLPLVRFGSSNFSIENTTIGNRLNKRLFLSVVDWETYYILKTFSHRKLPCFAFRVVTDRADSRAEADFRERHSADCANAAPALERLLRRLRGSSRWPFSSRQD